ncbi:hypothetical protein TNCV_1777891 [Trichonephila clavipes]|nr:hypothetical protein TNCV_1777891 [Trichonephila clavipes]
MAASGSSFNPTPLAHADNLGEGQPKGSPLQDKKKRGSKMSGVKKKLSGSQKRKIRKEKEYNINSKYAKLDNSLISASTSSCASASSSNARELDEQGQAHPGIQKRRIYDEAHFWLNGYVNKQNCRMWSEANPIVYVETPLHPEKLTVWGALWAGGILLQKR